MTIDRRTVLRSALGVAGGALAARAPAAARVRREAPADAVALLYDATRCIGCQACVVACKRARGLPPQTSGPWDAPTDLCCRTPTIIKRYDNGAERSYVKSQCMHCLDPACASACMLGALAKAERGVVAYEPSRCIGCRYCQIACPIGAPRFEWSSARPKIVKCELCRERLADGGRPACTEVCPAGALAFGPYREILAEAHRRIDRLPERYFPRVWGERDGGGTQVLLLSAVPFDKLGLPELGDQPVPHLAEALQHGLYRGFAAPAALYALLGAVMWRHRRRNGSQREDEETPEEEAS